MRNTLFHNRFSGPLLNYYRDLRDTYRLAENTQEIELQGQPLELPFQPVTLIVVSELRNDAELWLKTTDIQMDGVDETLLVGRQNGDSSLTGRDINQAVRQARNSLIILCHTGLVPAPGWLDNLLGPFQREPRPLFCIGQVQQNFTVRPAQQKFQPYLGIAFHKRTWALAAGFPESPGLHAAWVLFILRLKSLSGQSIRVTSAISRHKNGWSWSRIINQAYQEGQYGLFGDLIPGVFLRSVFVIGLIFLAVLTWGMLSSPWLGFVLLLALIPFGLFFGPDLLHFAGYAAGTLNRRSARQNLQQEHEARLREIVAEKKDAKGLIVYLPTHDWGYMFQRPQQLARHFAKAGYVFFYCTKNEEKDAIVGFNEVEPGLYICATPPETFKVLHRPILLIGSPWYAPMLDWFDEPQVIYDHYDDLKISSAREQDHQKLLAISQLVLATSRELYRAIQDARPDALLIPNAVDYDFVKKARPPASQSAPADINLLLQSGLPVIGYTGALAEWFDYKLVGQVAADHPDWQFVLIGVDYDDTLQQSGLLALPNIHWLGWKPYQDLFSYVWAFSVAIIPFIINDITKATSPVKLFEFFACQKPVISTPMPECLHYPEVFTASDAKTFSEKITQALIEKDNPHFCERLDQIAQQNTWNSRVEQIHQALSQKHIDLQDFQ